ncbi:hypothetical protein BB934_29470 (plasmid) [Microvirga ossetica]|uniref:Calcium-binding protein n=1 Tax=Microvirga ossetica TaxID=1882682 RepID=A0A1B2ER40_9HYPH|nr:PD40 domain-containing protein [Microvirga ossetica]ANY82430.1 hypothetical protein BB934_29470 [Microvirga ossetica]
MATQTTITDGNISAAQSFQVERVSVASDGTEANGGSGGFGSWGPAISANGRYVTYHSDASNLVPGDTNGFGDIFVFDRQAHTTERVSVAGDDTQGNESSLWPSISADGRFVAYSSNASNLVADDTNEAIDVFVVDRETGITERVSVASNGTEATNPQGIAHSRYPDISADGRYVTYWSEATNLVPGDTNGVEDVFVVDRQTHTTTRVSVASDGTQGNALSVEPDISADGRYITYTSDASNLVSGDTNGALDVFVFDQQTRTTTRVSMASDGTEGNGPAGSGIPSISADGRYVAYVGASTNLVPGDTNDTADVFVFDRETHTTTRVSVAGNGTQSNGFSSLPDVSADGHSVAYVSEASNLVPGDTNGLRDVFVAQMIFTPPVDGVVKDGDEGNNVLKGTRRDDILRGHGGKDWLFGDKGDDSLDGGQGDDKIFGGKGDDTVLGGAGSDRIFTGKGSDLVVFNEVDGHDRVFDFDQRCREIDPRFDRVQLDVSIGTNAIDDFAELQALIASGDIGLSTQHHGLTLTFDNGDALTLRGVRELSADDWLFI